MPFLRNEYLKFSEDLVTIALFTQINQSHEIEIEDQDLRLMFVIFSSKELANPFHDNFYDY